MMLAIALIRTALDNFIKTYGVEPTGLLMNTATYEMWKSERNSDTDLTTFRGLPIFKSNDVPQDQIRFVI